MGDISSQLVARTSSEPVGGLWIGVIKTGAVANSDTADISQAVPGATKVLYAHWTGTGAKANASEVLIGNTAKVTFGTGGGSDGEMFVVAEAV